jgi:hypothetical protein
MYCPRRQVRVVALLIESECPQQALCHCSHLSHAACHGLFRRLILPRIRDKILHGCRLKAPEYFSGFKSRPFRKG